MLAADVFAAVSLPPFATSAMDGYAVHAADLGGAPVPIAFRVAAGDPPGHLPAGSSAGIATGAPLPEGADAVVPIEDAREQDGLIAERPAVGACIRPAGGDIAAGGLVASAGTVLSPAVLAALAASGCDRVTVADRPRVAVLATGSELVAPGQPAEPGQIYESNATALAAQAARAGAELISSGRGTATTRRPPSGPSPTRSPPPTSWCRPAVCPWARTITSSRRWQALGVRELFWRVAHKPGQAALVRRGAVRCARVRPARQPGLQPGLLRAVRAHGAGHHDRSARQRPLPVARLAVPVRRLRLRDHAVRCRLEPELDGMRLHPQDVTGLPPDRARCGRPTRWRWSRPARARRRPVTWSSYLVI